MGDSVPAQNHRVFAALTEILHGRPAAARELAKDIEQASQTQQPGEYTFVLATIHAALGDEDRACDWAARGIRERSMFPLQLRDPMLDPVGCHTRFRTLVLGLGMP